MKNNNPEKLATQGTQDTGQIKLENTEGAIKKKNPETGNIGYTRHRTNTCLRIPKGGQ